MPGMMNQPMPPAMPPAAPPAPPAGPPQTMPGAPVAGAPKSTVMDPILQGVRTNLESKLPPALKDAVSRIVVAGMKVLYSRETRQSVQRVYDRLQQKGFQPPAIATGMVNLLGMIFRESKGKMNVEAAYPAGVILLTYVLDDLEKTRGLKIDQPLVTAVGKIMAQLFVRVFKIPNPKAGTPPQKSPMPPGGIMNKPMPPQAAPPTAPPQPPMAPGGM